MKHIVIFIVLFTIFLDMFALGMIYPLFTALVFDVDQAGFTKTAIFGLLVAAFPFGQFLGSPFIGRYPDRYGRRKMLILTLIGTIVSMLASCVGMYSSSLVILLAARVFGGLMAGNITLAYATLADYSLPEEKVKNFALIPLAMGLGFALGPYISAIVSTTSLAMPFLVASVLSGINLLLVLWKFPETIKEPSDSTHSSGFSNIYKAFYLPFLRSQLGVLFLMLTANLLFVQFLGPYAIRAFQLSMIEVGEIYANIGIAIGVGHLFLTRQLTKYFSSEQVLKVGLLALAILLFGLHAATTLVALHILTFFIMLACAVSYTNAMALVSNNAPQDRQGEIMGIAVSIQACAEFLPSVFLGLLASVVIPLLAAAFAALMGCFLVRRATSTLAIAQDLGKDINTGKINLE